MKELSIEQMGNIQGGTDWCFVARGVAGVGGGLLVCGASFCCPAAGFIYGAICCYAAVC